MSASSRITHAAAVLLRTRWLVRAPVWLYRARLGILLGPRFLMLEHTGRKSSARRYVVLEVAEHRAVLLSCMMSTGPCRDMAGRAELRR